MSTPVVTAKALFATYSGSAATKTKQAMRLLADLREVLLKEGCFVQFGYEVTAYEKPQADAEEVL